jgi:hypothetical protein
MRPNDKPTQIYTPIGRLVQGDAFEGQTHDRDNQPYVWKSGRNQGQPYTKYFVAIAIEKTNPDWDQFWAKMYQVARDGFSEKFGADGNLLDPNNFSWKYVDGDDTRLDQEGRRPCDKPGFTGCHVIRCSSNDRPPAVVADQGMTILTDPARVKRGHYIQLVIDVRANGDTRKPGLYVQHRVVEWKGYGPEISVGLDPRKVLAGADSAYVPQGMSAAPLGGATPPATSAPAAPGGMPAAQPSAPAAQLATPAQPPFAPPAGATAPAAPAAPAQPQFAPPAGATAPAAPAAPGGPATGFMGGNIGVPF